MNRIALLHSGQNPLTIQLVPRSDDNGSRSILLTHNPHNRIQLFLGNAIGTAENDASCMFQLIIIEFAEVFGVNLALPGINNGSKAIQLYIVRFHLFHGFDHITELSDAGRLDQNAIRCKLLQYLSQRGLKVTHQTAADASGIHFVDLDACFLHKATINANLAELVLDQHQLFAGIRFRDQLFNQSGLSCTQKAGKYINFSHSLHFLAINFSQYSTNKTEIQPQPYFYCFFLVEINKLFRHRQGKICKVTFLTISLKLCNFLLLFTVQMRYNYSVSLGLRLLAACRELKEFKYGLRFTLPQ